MGYTTSISFESDVSRHDPVIPRRLISALLQQATAHGSRRGLLPMVAGLIWTFVGVSLVAVYLKSPFWIVTLFAILAAFAASFYVTTYVCCLFGSQRKPVSPRQPRESDQWCVSRLNFDNEYWFARDLMKSLGYENWQSFNNAIHRAMGTCTTLHISIGDNFARIKRRVEGVECDDYKLSRVASSLIALNGDTYRPQVAAAQAYCIDIFRGGP
jgi:hypothetical protein